MEETESIIKSFKEIIDSTTAETEQAQLQVYYNHLLLHVMYDDHHYFNLQHHENRHRHSLPLRL